MSLVSARPASLYGHHAQAVELCQTVNRLLVQTPAEVPEIKRRAVIREGQDRDGIPPCQRSADRAASGWCCLTCLEDRRVTAFRQLDHDGVGTALFAVVTRQPGAQPSRLHTDDGVRARIEGRVLVEDLNADHVFLELIAASEQRFEDDEAQKTLETTHLTERGARQHAVQLLTFSLVRILLRGRFARARRHSVHPTRTRG